MKQMIFLLQRRDTATPRLRTNPVSLPTSVLVPIFPPELPLPRIIQKDSAQEKVFNSNVSLVGGETKAQRRRGEAEAGEAENSTKR